MSLAQQAGGAPNLVVRVAGDPIASAVAVQRLIQTADPDQPVRLVRSMDDIVGLAVADRRQHTTLLVAFGALAMLIASLGIYGLLAQSVAARSREIGLRMALGAAWRHVVAMVMTRGLTLSALGVILGTIVARVVTRAMQTAALRSECGRCANLCGRAGSVRGGGRRGVRGAIASRGSCRSDGGLAGTVTKV